MCIDSDAPWSPRNDISYEYVHDVQEKVREMQVRKGIGFVPRGLSLSLSLSLSLFHSHSLFSTLIYHSEKRVGGSLIT